MAVELATAYVSIVPSAKGIGKALAQELGDELGPESDRIGEESGKRAGDNFGKHMAIAAGAAFAAVKVGQFLGDTISAASDLQESVSKVNVVFGDSAGEIEDWSKTSATAMGISKQAALEATGTFGNLFSAMGIATPQAADMSTNLTQLASDLASFNNVKPEEALEALRAGLVGETEPMRRFGSNISAARIEMEAARLGLVKYTTNQKELIEIADKGLVLDKQWAEAAGKYGSESSQALAIREKINKNDEKFREAKKGEAQDLDAAAKAQASYSLIMQDTALAQGDFARTSDGLANKQRIMAAQWADMKTQIGGALLPALSAVVGFISNQLIPAIQWLGDHKELLIGAFVGATVALSAWAVVAIQAAIANGTLAASTLAAALPFIAIGVAIAALVAGVIWAYENWGWFREAVDAVARFLQDPLLPIIEKIAGFIREHFVPTVIILGNVLTLGVVPAARAVVDVFRDHIIPAVSDVIGWFGDLAASASEKVDAIKGFFGDLKTFFTNLPGDMKTAAGNMWDWIWDTFKSAINKVIDGWNTLRDKLQVSVHLDIPLAPDVDFDSGPILPRITPLALGGRAEAGRIHLVGENGPELFIPDTPGTVVPNGAAVAGGNTYVLHLHSIHQDPDVIAKFRQMELLQGPL